MWVLHLGTNYQSSDTKLFKGCLVNRYQRPSSHNTQCPVPTSKKIIKHFVPIWTVSSIGNVQFIDLTLFADISVTGDLDKKRATNHRPKYSLVVYIDENEVLKSEKWTMDSLPRFQGDPRL